MKFLIFSLIFLCFGLLGQEEGQNTCDLQNTLGDEDIYSSPEISNLTRNGRSLGPTRDQDSVGWCYAYAAADLMEDWLKNHPNANFPSDQNLSPFPIAINHHRTDFSSFTQALHSQAVRRQAAQPYIEEYNERLSQLMEQRNQVEQQKNEIWRQTPPSEQVQALRTSREDLQSELDQIYQQSPHLRDLDSDALEAETTNSRVLELRRQMIANYAEEIGLREKYFNQNLQDMPLHQQYLELTDGIEYYGSLLQNLLEEENPLLEEFPEGGIVKNALEAENTRLCYESEVNSRDLHFPEVVEEHAELLQLTSSPLARDLIHEMTDIWVMRDNERLCAFGDMATSLFPGLNDRSLQNLWEIASNIEPYQDLLQELINHSCQQKPDLESPQPPPQIIAATTTVSASAEEKESLFAILDAALEQGKVATVDYDAHILYRSNLDSENTLAHVSVITGSMDICGQSFYILRNSWGEGACASGRDTFLDETSDFTQINQRYEACSTLANQRFAEEFGEGKCETEECARRRSELLSPCSRELERERASMIDLPYGCDEEGNYIISKEHLQKGINGATYIAN